MDACERHSACGQSFVGRGQASLPPFPWFSQVAKRIPSVGQSLLGRGWGPHFHGFWEAPQWMLR